jgi:ApaG protein
MNANAPLRELPGLVVTLDRLVYRHIPEESPDRPHCFVYFITIRNGTDQTLTIKGRKWVVAHDDGSTTVVEGDGVVGQTPILEPGQHFTYNSQHCIQSPRATAEGSYLAITEGGEKVVTRIPCFEMVVPPVA